MEIQLLTQEDCSFCEDAKATLHRMSAKYGFTVTTIQLDGVDGQALAERAGVMFAPGILIDGEPFSHGRLSEKKLRRELDRRIGVVRGA
jgi:glutaredoxin